MRNWVLDDGPLDQLARTFNPRWSWPAGKLHLSESVAEAVRLDKSGRRARIIKMSGSGGDCFVVHVVRSDTDVATMIYEHLRRNSAHATRDLGEDESIALCALQLRDAIFVTMDKGAAYQALVELGPGRVASPFDLWLDLHEEQLVTPEELDALCSATARGDAGIAGVPLRFWKSP